jgi:hypothetical protein
MVWKIYPSSRTFPLVRWSKLLTHSWSWALLEKLPIVQLLKNFPALYGKPKVHYRVHKSPPLDRILSQIDPIHTIHTISVTTILLLSTQLVLVFLVVSFLLASSLIFYMHSYFPHSCYIPCPSNPPWMYHSCYTWRKAHVLKHFVMQFSPTSCHFIPLRSKYSPQYPVLKQLQPSFLP